MLIANSVVESHRAKKLQYMMKGPVAIVFTIALLALTVVRVSYSQTTVSLNETSSASNASCIEQRIAQDPSIVERCGGQMNNETDGGPLISSDADIDVICSDECSNTILQVYSDCNQPNSTEALSLILACSKDAKGRLCGNVFSELSDFNSTEFSNANDICEDISESCTSECSAALQSIGCCTRNFVLLFAIAFNASEESLDNITEGFDRCNVPVCTEPLTGTTELPLPTMEAGSPGPPANSSDQTPAIIGGAVAAAIVLALCLAIIVSIVIIGLVHRKKKIKPTKYKGTEGVVATNGVHIITHPGETVEMEHIYEELDGRGDLEASQYEEPLSTEPYSVLTQCPVYAEKQGEQFDINKCPAYEGTSTSPDAYTTIATDNAYEILTSSPDVSTTDDNPDYITMTW